MSKESHKGPVSELVERLSHLEQALKSSQDELMRAMADFDNFRRRVERDIEQRQRAALENLIVDLLPVLDDFELAMRYKSDGQSQGAVEQGIKLIHRKLCDTLSRHGLEAYSMCGQQFDPSRAEAISFVHSDEHEANVVVEEACKGYECRGRVIRPARVVVARPKPAPSSGTVPKNDGGETGSSVEVV